MRPVNPFTRPGNWYKGNLHTHTTNSDGAHSPEDTIALYRAAGYDFLAITDHSVVTRVTSPSKKMLLLIGTELDGDRSEIGESFHILGFGLTKTGTPPRGAKVAEAIAWINEHGGAAVLAHPYWSGLTYRDLVKQNGHIGIEVFNTVCEQMIAKGHSSVQWDDLLNRGQLLWGFAVDDCHSERSATYASVMVKAPSLTRAAIMKALRTGCFYSTNGPFIEDVVVKLNKEIYVRTSPVKEINFMSQSWLGRQNRVTGKKTITEATFIPRGQEPYVRIEIVDAEGRRAWTNPLMFKK